MIALLAVIFFVAADAQTKQWTMEECVDHALKNNLQIQLNDLGVRNGAIDLKQSKANLYPNLRAGGNYGLIGVAQLIQHQMILFLRE